MCKFGVEVVEIAAECFSYAISDRTKGFSDEFANGGQLHGDSIAVFE